jgi:ornithine cyclodeaminase/alanine dehydrogenase-like protein (mu-crystallin family)
MGTQTIRFLSAEDVRKSLNMNQAIEAVREAFMQLSAGTAAVPPRTHIDIARQNATALFMPVYLPGIQKIGVKVVSVFGNNPSQGLPLIHALVAVFDGATGRPLAVMDGEYLTALRTGAASGLATDLLARRRADTVAIFGAGRQGRTQLEGVGAVRAIKQAYIIDPDAARAAAFAAEMSEQLGLKVDAAASTDVLSEVDIICTATTSADPVFLDDKLKTGVHINGVGSFKPSLCEIPPETVVRAKVVVDSMASCLSEAGDLIMAMERGLFTQDRIYAEIGEIAAGKKAGRSSDEEITFFKSVGNAAQDLAAAARVLYTAQKLDLGIEVKL